MQNQWSAQPYQSGASKPKRSPLRFLVPLLLVLACLIVACVGFAIFSNSGGEATAPAVTPTSAPKVAATSTPVRPQAPAAPTEPALGIIEKGIPRETSLEASAPKPTVTAAPTAKPAVDTVNRSGLLIRNQKIYDLDGKLAYQGDIDLKPVLDRIAAGRKDPHPNDGSTFTNRERRLPIMSDAKYYTEYVVRTPNMRDVGPQRLIIGKGAELYYTPDHYVTFVKLSR